MLLTPQTGPPRDLAGFAYEVKWDGLRTLVRVEGGTVHLCSRSGRDRTHCFPELQALAHQLRVQPVLLDSELVVVQGGRFHFGRALTRDRMTESRAIRQAAEATPATLMVFDLLAVGDTSLLAQPLSERREHLQLTLGTAGHAQVVETFPTGQALFAATSQAGMEGVVGKRLDSPYLPGTRSPHWHKYKHRRTQEAVIVGLSPAAGIPTALHLAAYDTEDRLQYIGKVGSGLSTTDAAHVAASLPPAPSPPCAGAPARVDVAWVQPLLTARVAYLEWTDHLHLRQPSLLGWSTVQPSACRLP